MSKTLKLAAVVLVAGLAACSDNTAAPRASTQPETVHGGGVTAALTTTDTFRFTVTINPWQRSIWDLGAGNYITFPAHSLCDPYRSTYGVTEWDKSCTAATSSYTINVKAFLDSQGHPRVDFSPSVRFVPSADPMQWVVLTLADNQAALNPWFNINYCPTLTSSCYDEAKVDPSLATLHDPITGKITRRVKHFSGYNVAAGDALMNLGTAGAHVAAPAPAGRPVSSNPLEQSAAKLRTKKSGYMLASG